MNGPRENQNVMPDVPDVDFIGALCEIWLGLNCSAYHMAYVRVYSQTAALRTEVDQLRKEEQAIRDMTQVDVVICRAHLAAFFWQLEHVFESLRIAVTRGQKEHQNLRYFWSFEKRLNEVDQTLERREISAYRNKGHQMPAVIGCAFECKGGKFRYHFLPYIEGLTHTETVDMNDRLQHYFEFVSNLWFSFVPANRKPEFPRDFSFPVTIPHSYIGELPPELRQVPQLEIQLKAELKDLSRIGDEAH
jgi:hypothetical protein